MTPDEARRVLVAARETAQVEQWQGAYDLLFPVHEEKVLTGAEQGDAAFVLGEACRGLESWDAAVFYYEEASTTASGDNQAKAKERLAEIRRQDAAVDAEYEGVAQAEAEAVLAAADDALARHDFDDALAHYRAAYQGVIDGKPKYRAALGIARSCANLGNFDEAAQYADYVIDSAPDDLKGQAQTLLEWIKDHRAATTASGDGTSPDEFRESWDAANGAFFNGAYDQALPLYLAGKESEQLSGTDRGKMAFNAGICQRFLGNDTEARALFEFAVSHGPPGTVAKAQSHIEKIDRRESAAELVAELAED